MLNVDNQLLTPGQEVDLKTGLAEKLRAVGLVEEVKPKKKAVKKDGRGKS